MLERLEPQLGPLRWVQKNPPGLTHREPIADEVDFERFVACCKPLLHPARDVMWVMAGRTESNLNKLKKRS